MLEEEGDARLPTALWVDTRLHQLTLQGIPFYIVNKGAYSGGTVLLKINGLEHGCILLTQQRDLMTGKLGWMHALDEESPEESAIDAYIRRALDRDPDLWVIEIEDRKKRNPFEGALIV
ncbi:MAG: DUF1491 family protein [Alphaproteobacteria bacterium]|nr:DUF1491 family protein [Alphaproteobacteria bacterium]